jgi:hypothetical protein
MSKLAADVMSVKALKTELRWDISLRITVDEMFPCEKVAKSNRVTTPKLFAPPLSAL